MAMLTVEGFEVPILPGTQLTDAKHGDIGRAYSGKLRTDVIASHRVGRIVASIFDTANDAGALRAILNTPGPILLGGTLIGDDAYFHVSNLVVSPVTADRLKFDFDIAETDDSPSELLFSFDGDAPGQYTFTRAGAVGKYVDSAGVLQDAAANVFRRTWLYTGSPVNGTLPDTQAGLIEPARTNLVTSDDLTAWSASGTPVVTGSISDPAGGTGAYTVADDDGAATEYIGRTVSFTGDAVKAFVFTVREKTMPASGPQQLKVTQTSGTPADKLSLDIASWSSGEPSVSASVGTYLGKRYVGNGYWAIYGLTASITAAETNQAQVVPALTAAQTGSIDVYRVNAYDATVPLWSIVDASETKNADVWYADIAWLPQDITVYVKMLEAGSVLQSSSPVFHIGSGTITTAERLTINENGGTGYYQAVHGHPDGNAVATLSASTPSFGDTVEFALQLTASGIVFYQSINGAAATSATDSTARAYRPSWAGARLYLNGPASFATGINPIVSAKVVTGTRTLAEMRDWDRAMLWPRIA